MKAIYLFLLAVILSQQTALGQNSNPLNKAGSRPFALGVVNQLKSVQLAETRTLNIYLPEGYNKDPKATYPVIYLLDGSANEDFVHIVGIVQFLTMIEAMPKFIVVGIANVDRKRDFTFPTQNKADLKAVPTSGKSANFIAFVQKELQPYVEKKYRTNTKKTIIGQSLGGLLATEILLKKPDLFNQYIIVSPSLWWNDESLLADAPALLKAQAAKPMQVSISVGNEGKQMADDAAKLAELLRSSGNTSLQLNITPFPEENHLTILHNAAYKALLMLNKKQ